MYVTGRVVKITAIYIPGDLFYVGHPLFTSDSHSIRSFQCPGSTGVGHMTGGESTDTPQDKVHPKIVVGSPCLMGSYPTHTICMHFASSLERLSHATMYEANGSGIACMRYQTHWLHNTLKRLPTNDALPDLVHNWIRPS